MVKLAIFTLQSKVLSIWKVLSKMKVMMTKQSDMLLEEKDCSKAMLFIKDALEAVEGRWKLLILYSLCSGPKRFTEIAKEVHGIRDKALAKELRSLQESKLIKRDVYDTFPPTVEYTITEHGMSLRNVLFELLSWGRIHRKEILG